MTLGDFRFFFNGIAVHFDNFEPVAQGGLYSVERIACGDEHNLAQVIIEVDIIVVEGMILFGIKHFQQRTGRISVKALSGFVNLVQHKKRIRGAGLFE